MLRRLLVILLFPFVVCTGVLLLSVVLVAIFLLVEMLGIDSLINPALITYPFFGLAFLVSLYGSWRICGRMWSPQVVTAANPDTPESSRS